LLRDSIAVVASRRPAHPASEAIHGDLEQGAEWIASSLRASQ
jgi:hypothetical protein